VQRNFPSSFLRHRTRPKPPIFVIDYLSPPKSLSSPSILANSGHSDTANRSLVQCQPRVPPLVCLTMSSQPLLQATPGKRIALPTRVEPKVFFANERTFLSWLSLGVVIAALAIGMLNFGDKPAFISAFLFTLAAVLTMIYALVTFHWRARSIRQRGQAGFDDKLGPTLLTLVILIAMIVNFVLRFSYDHKDDVKH